MNVGGESGAAGTWRNEMIAQGALTANPTKTSQPDIAIWNAWLSMGSPNGGQLLHELIRIGLGFPLCRKRE